MYETLVDAFNLQIHDPVYVSIILGMTVTIILNLKLELKLVHSFVTSKYKDLYYQVITLNSQIEVTFNKKLFWMIRCIRRKISPGEKPDSLFPLSIYSILIGYFVNNHF